MSDELNDDNDITYLKILIINSFTMINSKSITINGEVDNAKLHKTGKIGHIIQKYLFVNASIQKRAINFEILQQHLS